MRGSFLRTLANLAVGRTHDNVFDFMRRGIIGLKLFVFRAQ